MSRPALMAMLPAMLLAATAASESAMTRDDAQKKALASADRLHYGHTKMVDVRFEKNVWEIALVGKTDDGCGLLELHIPSPSGSVKYDDRHIAGDDVKVEDCVALYQTDRTSASLSDEDVGAKPTATAKAADDDLPIVDDTPAPKPTPRPSATPAPTPQPVRTIVANTPAPTPTPSRIGGKPPVGVPECDQFLASYAACAATLPENKRQAELDILAALRDAWHDAAAGEARANLADSCQKTAEATRSKPSLAACHW